MLCLSQWSIWAVLLVGAAVFLGVCKLTDNRQCWLWLTLPLFVLCGYLCCDQALQRQQEERGVYWDNVDDSLKNGATGRNDAETVRATASGRVIKLTERESRREYLLTDVALKTEGDVDEARVKLVLAYLPANCSAIEGNRISVSGNLELFERPTNPGQFDYSAYQASIGVNLLLDDCTGTVIVKGERALAGRLGNLRRYLVEVLVQAGGESGGTMAALVLGDKTYLPDERYQLYLDSGIGHILTLSGLHLSLFGVGLYGILRKRLTLPQWPSAILMTAGICAYVSLIGGGISASRAAIALIISLLGGCLGKTYDSLSAASLGMILILSEYPLQISRPSFWLSFGAVFAMGGFLPALNQWLRPQQKLTKLLIPPLVIQLALMPVTAVNQYTVQTYSVLLNLVVVPMMGLLLGGSIVVLLSGIAIPDLAIGVAKLIGLAFEGIDWLCRLSMDLPGSIVAVGHPSAGSLVLYGLILGGFIVCLYRRNRLDWNAMETAEYREETMRTDKKRKVLPMLYGRKRFAILLIVTVVLTTVLVLDLGGRQLSITFLDVGQGDCIVIETPGGTAIMVDGGSTSERKVGEYRILPYLTWAGIDRLDYVVLTHLDEDHVNGVEELLNAGFPIGAVLISSTTTDGDEVERLCNILVGNDIKMVEISQKDRLICGKVEIECMLPDEKATPASENEASVVLRLSYGKFSCLLTGDIEGKGEERLEDYLRSEESGSESQITLLKVAHHGSRYSTPESFLEMIDPVAAVISCGQDNSYGHPHGELLERLEDIGCDIYCTADCGAVLVKTDGKQWSIVGYRGK